LVLADFLKFLLFGFFFFFLKMMALKRRLSMRNKYFTSVLYRFFADTQQIQLHAEHCGMWDYSMTGWKRRVSNIFRYLWAHKFQKTELIVAHSLQCWAIQSMVDSIKGLASTVSSRRWCPLKGLQVWCPEPCTAQSAKYAGTWLFIQCSCSIP